MKFKNILFSATGLLLAFLLSGFLKPGWQSKFVKESDGVLTYTPDENGNIVPDFSRVGYHQGDKAIPDVPVVKTISAPASGESRTLIQEAIDEVSQMPCNSDGIRGAILLKKGIYYIPGSIKISKGGVVLRGEGDDEKGTVLVASGKGQRSLLIISGSGARREIPGTVSKIIDKYVPTGACSFSVESAGKYSVGDQIVVFRPGTDSWIHDLKMDQIVPRQGTLQWKAPEYNLNYERTITKIEGNRIFIDNPIVMAMEPKYGGGSIFKFSFPGRISEVGVEKIMFKSDYTSDIDEDHSWKAIDFGGVENSWVRDVTSKYFAYSCVDIENNGKYITVTHSKCLDPKSVITGGRRYSFCVNGQMNLVMNCATDGGRHDYVTGARVCGPNVFYHCKSVNTHADIGPHHRWATGTLYDNITTDGEINVQDRGDYGSGHGWAGATQVLWNCNANKVCVQNPWVSAKNYCIGLTGKKTKGRFQDRNDGEWEGQDKSGLQPLSLYMAQLNARKKINN